MSDRDFSVVPSLRHPSAKVVGVLSAWVSLGAAVALAYGLRDIVHGTAGRGVAFVTACVVARALSTLASDLYLSQLEQRSREHWHVASLARLARSSASDIHRLDTAIDHLSAEPALQAVESGAGASLLALGAIFYFGGWLCVLIVLALMALSVPAYIAAGRASIAALEAFHERRSSLVARQLRLLREITDLRALGAVAYGADEIAAATEAENRGVLAGVRVAIRSTLVTEFLGGVSVGLVAMVVGIRLWHHHIGLGPALGAVLVTAEMFAALRRFGGEFHRRDDARSARELLLNSSLAPAPTSAARLELHAVKTAAPARAVSLTLDQRGRARLNGPSGIGKSSLIDTALGLREPISGEVHRRAERVALIRPANHFVHDSVRNNLSLGSEFSDSQVRDALNRVGLRSARFSDLETVMAEDGRDFSTGERIQLSFARALLHSPELVVIDDVASSLDASTRSLLGDLVATWDAAVLEASHELCLLSDASDVIEMGPS